MLVLKRDDSVFLVAHCCQWQTDSTVKIVKHVVWDRGEAGKRDGRGAREG